MSKGGIKTSITSYLFRYREIINDNTKPLKVSNIYDRVLIFINYKS